jgi:hypothetical protein
MATKIMLIRHAEKPANAPPAAGVSEDGSQDPEELTVRGWQRAGALVRFFAPASGVLTDPRLVTPNAIFAAGVAHHSKSLRPWHTVLPLALFLAKTPDLSHAKGDENALVSALLQTSGAVLIAWQHEAIPAIAKQILGNDQTCPQAWPDDRFDMVWLLDALPNGKWSFTQIPQLLLQGDKADPI